MVIAGRYAWVTMPPGWRRWRPRRSTRCARSRRPCPPSCTPWVTPCKVYTSVSSVITKGDGHIFFDSLKNNTYGMSKVIEHMFYIQFFKRNPFLKRKMPKKIFFVRQKCVFWPKFAQKMIFLHISAHFVHISALFLQSAMLPL